MKLVCSIKHIILLMTGIQKSRALTDVKNKRIYKRNLKVALCKLSNIVIKCSIAFIFHRNTMESKLADYQKEAALQK